MRRLPFLAGSLLAAITVSACNSTQDVLEPSAIAASPPAPGTLQAETGAVPVQNASTSTTAALNPGIAARTRLRFDPIVGATVDVATPLTERLAQRARARGISLAGSADPSTTHILKGYFSTLTEGGQTTVIYLGDMPLPDGQSAENLEMARLHIDMLDVLKQKTDGNLTAQESAFLEDLLYRLRVRYVQKQG